MLIDLCGLLGQDVGTHRSPSTLAWEDRAPQPGLLPFGCLSKEGGQGVGRWKVNHGQSWKEWGHLGPPFQGRRPRCCCFLEALMPSLAAAILTSGLVWGTALWGPTFCVCFRVSRWISRPTGQTAPWTSPPEVTWAPWSQHILNKLSTLPQLPTATSPDMFPIPVTSTPPSPTPEIFALFLTPPSRHSAPSPIKDHVPGSLTSPSPVPFPLQPLSWSPCRLSHDAYKWLP